MRCKNKTLLGTWLATAALGAAGAPPALAQDAIVLEEITVTAQRREERLEDVPISISAMKGERLASILEGGEDIRALAGRVPGLNAESSNGRVAPRFYIRGLGNTDFDLAASQPVSIVMDEVEGKGFKARNIPASCKYLIDKCGWGRSILFEIITGHMDKGY